MRDRNPLASASSMNDSVFGSNFSFRPRIQEIAAAWQAMRPSGPVTDPGILFHGSDRNAAAISMSRANAKRAGGWVAVLSVTSSSYIITGWAGA